MNLKIEKNVPIPGARSVRANWKYLAEQMKVGDSILIKAENEQQAISQRQSLKTAMRNLGYKPLQRQVTRGDHTRFRVWRIK